MKRISVFFIALVMMALSACTRIETGEVGLRTNFSNVVEQGELQPGSWNQTIVGKVDTFPIRDLSTHLDNIVAQAGDNSTLKKFEVTVVYNIVPSAVSDLWSTKSRAYHAESNGDILLMYHYVENVASNAAAKAARKYPAMKLNDMRKEVEEDTKRIMMEKFAEEKLDGAIHVSQVQVNKILPDDAIVASANRVLAAQNELATKTIEVQTADQEAQRIAKLNANSKAIEYMTAQAQMTIAEAVKAGKVNTIVIPYDFKGIVNVK